MKGFWWKLPLLRGLSPVRRGFLEAVVVISIGAASAGYAINVLFSDPGAVSDSLAQIGATLLVAYAVQTGWVVQNSRRRGADRENWVGVTTGIGSCGLVGILVALCLSAHREPFNLLEGFGFAWAVISLGSLGLWTALQTWTMYDLAHKFSTEYPDE